MRVYCDKDELDKLLDQRPLKWLCEKVNELGVKTEYKSFLQNISNSDSSKVECRLGIALAIADILKVDVSKLFCLKKVTIEQ